MAINFRTQIYKLGRELIPYFLRASDQLYWATQGGLLWVTNQFQAWSVDSADSRHRHWVEALLKPVDWLNYQMATYANDVYYRLHITGQVVYLEHYLNDLYDPTNRAIYITDDSLVEPPYLLLKNNVPGGLNLGTIDLYRREDYEGQGSFIIHVPGQSLTDLLKKKISSATNRYRMAGAHYTIVTKTQ